MRKKLTQRLAETAKPEAKAYQIHDPVLPGFALRVQPSGAKMWYLIQKKSGRKQTLTLGRFPQMTHGMALEAARRILSGDDEDHKRAPRLKAFLDETYGPWLEVHRKSGDAILARLRSFPFLGHHLDEITASEWERYRTRRIKTGRKPGTLDRDLAAMKSALNRAVEWDIIDTNPLSRVKPLGTDRKGVVRYLDTGEEARLLSALEGVDAWLRTLVTLALNTGLRRGELFSLTWRDVDLVGRSLTVHGPRAKGGQTRHVPLSHPAVAALKAWRSGTHPLPAVPVFERREFRKSWASLLRRARVEQFRFHDCRHYADSRIMPSRAAGEWQVASWRYFESA